MDQSLEEKLRAEIEQLKKQLPPIARYVRVNFTKKGGARFYQENRMFDAPDSHLVATAQKALEVLFLTSTAVEKG